MSVTGSKECLQACNKSIIIFNKLFINILMPNVNLTAIQG